MRQQAGTVPSFPLDKGNLKGWHWPSLLFFVYPFCMPEVTAHQLKRIRKADAADIARMANQERYWTSEALREILQRIDKLNSQDPQEALAAANSALLVVQCIRSVSSDLRALTQAVHASTLRSNGQPASALAVYEEILSLSGLSETGRGDILTKMAATLVFLGKLGIAHETINAALRTKTDRVQALAIRGWILFHVGDLKEALADCMAVLELVRASPRSDYSMLSAITTACNVLSFETGLNVDPDIFQRLRNTIEEYRQIFTDGGSGYRKVQVPRLMLSRAEALIFMRNGQPQQAIAPLQRAVRGLAEKYPDQALASALDLVCAYAQAGRSQEAAIALQEAQTLMGRIPFNLKPLTKNALKAAIESNAVRYGEAVELRLMLRPAKLQLK